jgi:hypothetical protein
MSTRDTAGGPSTRARRRLAVVAALAGLAVLVGAYAFNRLTGHGDPDPGGRILHALEPIGRAVPADATEVRPVGGGEPQWSSCDGRQGTFGWNEIFVGTNFKTTMQPDALISLVDRRMVAIGWTPLWTRPNPIGPVRQWTRTLEDGTKAQAMLAPATADNGATITWDLTVHAPPHGPHSSGC